MEDVQEFIKFVNASPSPFHCVASAAAMLDSAGFVRISEGDEAAWSKAVKPGALCYFTRDQATLFAFAVGGQYRPGNGVTVVAAHTDSPCLKIKPLSRRMSQGCLQVGVETYGGGLWTTWFDRDLSVAGRAVVALPDGGFESRLVRIDRPILRIPSLAIHLNREVNESGFNPNKESHTCPVLATEVKAALAGIPAGDSRHHQLLLRLLADELRVDPSQIRDFELSLYDTQPAAVGGALNEFVFSARLDNQMMSFCSVRSLLRSVATPGSLDAEPNVRLVALFDHEEIGSESARGAFSTMMVDTLTRLAGPAMFYEAIRRSFLVSADMAHAVHPNYPEKHECEHRPRIHGGLVIKENANQRYATTGISAFIIRELATRHGITVQDFVVRNDSACGSTIGPMLSANCGIRTVDVGIPQWGMHSIRETCGTADVESAVRLLDIFFREFPGLAASIKVD